MPFRYKRGIRVSRTRQIYIYAVSLNYKSLSPAQQKKIDKLCARVGGENSGALFDFVTTEETATAVCMKHHIASHTTLYRLVKQYYEEFPLKL